MESVGCHSISPVRHLCKCSNSQNVCLVCAVFIVSKLLEKIIRLAESPAHGVLHCLRISALIPDCCGTFSAVLIFTKRGKPCKRSGIVFLLLCFFRSGICISLRLLSSSGVSFIHLGLKRVYTLCTVTVISQCFERFQGILKPVLLCHLICQVVITVIDFFLNRRHTFPAVLVRSQSLETGQCAFICTGFFTLVCLQIITRMNAFRILHQTLRHVAVQTDNAQHFSSMFIVFHGFITEAGIIDCQKLTVEEAIQAAKIGYSHIILAIFPGYDRIAVHGISRRITVSAKIRKGLGSLRILAFTKQTDCFFIQRRIVFAPGECRRHTTEQKQHHQNTYGLAHSN